MRIALIIGHSPSSQGARNKKHGISEFEWNEAFARDLFELICGDIVLVHRDTLEALPAKVNALEPDIAISLHCNAFDERSGGTETLYYHRSESGKQMAEILQRHVVTALHSRNRGAKAKTSEDRGGYLLRYTIAPCIIAEPFFIDYDIDFENAMRYRDALLGAFADAIHEIEARLNI